MRAFSMAPIGRLELYEGSSLEPDRRAVRPDGHHTGAHFLPDGDRNCAGTAAALFRAKEKPVMSSAAIAFVLVLAATAANAQATRSGQSHTPAVASADETRPFLFDGRMRGDGARQRTRADDRHPNAGAVVLPPKASQPERE